MSKLLKIDGTFALSKLDDNTAVLTAHIPGIRSGCHVEINENIWRVEYFTGYLNYSDLYTVRLRKMIKLDTPNKVKSLTLVAAMRQVLDALEAKLRRNEIDDKIVKYLEVTNKSLETGFDLVNYALKSGS